MAEKQHGQQSKPRKSVPPKCVCVCVSSCIHIWGEMAYYFRHSNRFSLIIDVGAPGAQLANETGQWPGLCTPFLVM